MAATIDDLLNELRLVREGQESANDAAREQAERERALLGLPEKQYEELLEQRKVAEEAKEEMEKMREALGEEAENNREFQEARKKFDAEQLKAQKLEKKRNLFERFKETKAGGKTVEVGEKVGRGAMKGLRGVFGFIQRFLGIFTVMLIPALVLFVNSPAFETAKKLIKDLIDYIDPGSPDGPFGPNGFIRMLIDKIFY